MPGSLQVEVAESLAFNPLCLSWSSGGLFKELGWTRGEPSVTEICLACVFFISGFCFLFFSTYLFLISFHNNSLPCGIFKHNFSTQLSVSISLPFSLSVNSNLSFPLSTVELCMSSRLLYLPSLIPPCPRLLGAFLVSWQLPTFASILTHLVDN